MKKTLRIELESILAPVASERSLTEAVEKVPTFGGSSDVTLSLDKVEKLVAKHYKVVKGSLKFLPIQTFPSSGRVESFVTFNATDAEDSENILTGSINVALELHADLVRVYSLIRIDG